MELRGSNQLRVIAVSLTAEWTFSTEGFKQFFRALMSDLNDALDSEGGRLLITRRHGVEETVELVSLMKGLNVGLRGLS